MSQFPVKVGDEVVVIAGASKFRNSANLPSTGKVTSVNRSKNTVTVEGVNLRTKAVRPSDERPNGGFVQIEGPIHVSNVMKKAEFETRKFKQS